MAADQNSLAQLVEEHRALVLREAKRVRTVYASHVELDDLVASGMEGLVDAHARFEPSRGLRFSTFAYYRIRGAMLDAVRRSGYASRRLHAKLRAAEAIDRLGEELAESRAGASAEARASHDATAATLDATLSRITASVTLAIVGQGEHDAPASPEALLLDAECAASITEAVRRLPDRERALVEGHYFEGKNFDDVAAALGISKSWASRLHTKALDRIRASLEA